MLYIYIYIYQLHVLQYTFTNRTVFLFSGVYDVISNLGSMTARFIFLPIEENGYLFFSQSLVRGVPANKQATVSLSLIIIIAFVFSSERKYVY